MAEEFRISADGSSAYSLSEEERSHLSDNMLSAADIPVRFELIGTAQVVTILPGDLFVFRTPRRLRGSEAAGIQHQLVTLLPTSCKVLILEEGADFAVVRQEEGH